LIYVKQLKENMLRVAKNQVSLRSSRTKRISSLLLSAIDFISSLAPKLQH